MTTPILDPLALDQLRPFKGHEGGSLLGNLIQVYLDLLPNRVEGLLAAHQEGDANSVFKIAHTLKSTSASLGAYQLQGMCQRFEDAGRLDNLAGIADLIPMFEAETAKVKAALLDEQKKLGAMPK
ncbi:MAG: Hpt domain-containing protein [Holophagaceae bacterium]|nr:Hpt domain-containing protein [Holophagaceae bacterium]